MRKKLIVLLFVLLPAIASVHVPLQAAAGGSGGDQAPMLTISYVRTSQDIAYAWDLAAALTGDGNGSSVPLPGLFRVLAARSEAVNEMTVSVEAELNQEIALDTVSVALGGTVDGNFEPVETYEVSDFTQQTNDGTTLISLAVTADLLDLDADRLQQVRLSVPVEKKQGQSADLTATHEIQMPESAKTLNAAVVIETNLLKALADFGTTEVTADDWTVTEAELGEGDLFAEEVRINFNDAQDVRDMVVTVILKGDDGVVLQTVEPILTFGSGGTVIDPPLNQETPQENSEENDTMLNTLPGSSEPVNGFWVSPGGDSFELGRRAVTISFWLESPPAEEPMLCVIESGDMGKETLTMEDAVARISTAKTGKGRGGGRSLTCGENISKSYYKYKLKASDLSSLKEGGSYALAVMVDGELLFFGENKPAMMSFAVAEDAFTARGAAKQNSGYAGSGGNHKRIR